MLDILQYMFLYLLVLVLVLQLVLVLLATPHLYMYFYLYVYLYLVLVLVSTCIGGNPSRVMCPPFMPLSMGGSLGRGLAILLEIHSTFWKCILLQQTLLKI